MSAKSNNYYRHYHHYYQHYRCEHASVSSIFCPFSIFQLRNHHWLAGIIVSASVFLCCVSFETEHNWKLEILVRFRYKRAKEKGTISFWLSFSWKAKPIISVLNEGPVFHLRPCSRRPCHVISVIGICVILLNGRAHSGIKLNRHMRNNGALQVEPLTTSVHIHSVHMHTLCNPVVVIT